MLLLQSSVGVLGREISGAEFPEEVGVRAR